MGKQRRAVIDIGTNSIKLLVADVDGEIVQPIQEESRQTRLGEGFYQNHHLQPGPIERTAQAVAAFAVKARDLGSESLKAVATSAARDARNPEELRQAVSQASGLEIEIISGEQEAEFAFRGVSLAPELMDKPLLIMEVGGGSTQLILGRGKHQHFRRSYALGTVRLLEKNRHSDPPEPRELQEARAWLKSFIETQVRPALEPALRHESDLRGQHQPVQLVAAGGTSTILGRMDAGMETFDRERLDATRITLDRLHSHVALLWSLPLAERKGIPGLPPNRADVILGGVLIFEGIMEDLGFPDLRISTRGLRFGLLMDRHPHPTASA